MPPTLAPLLSSRRFLISVAALAAIFLQQRYGLFVNNFQLSLISILAAVWVVGDGIRSDLPAFLLSSSPLADKAKALTSRPRFLAVAGAIGVIVGRSRISGDITDFQLQFMTLVVSAWVLSDSFRPAVPPETKVAQPTPPEAPVKQNAPAPVPSAPSVIPPPPSPQ